MMGTNRGQLRRNAARRAARAAHLYALVLRLYPREHRQAFGEQMLRTFQDHYRDVVESHGGSESRFWLAVVGGEGQSLVREHLSALAERRLAMRKVLIGAVAAALVVAGVLAATYRGGTQPRIQACR